MLIRSTIHSTVHTNTYYETQYLPILTCKFTDVCALWLFWNLDSMMLSLNVLFLAQLSPSYRSQFRARYFQQASMWILAALANATIVRCLLFLQLPTSLIAIMALMMALCFQLPRACWSSFTTPSTAFFLSLLPTLLCLPSLFPLFPRHCYLGWFGLCLLGLHFLMPLIKVCSLPTVLKRLYLPCSTT